MDGIIRRERSNALLALGCCQTRGSGQVLRPYKFSGLVFGPAEGGEGLLEAGKGEADNVEVAAFDAGDVAAGAALDGGSASLIVGFGGRKGGGAFFSGER